MPSTSELELKYNEVHGNDFHYLSELNREPEGNGDKQEWRL